MKTGSAARKSSTTRGPRWTGRRPRRSRQIPRRTPSLPFPRPSGTPARAAARDDHGGSCAGASSLARPAEPSACTQPLCKLMIKQRRRCCSSKLRRPVAWSSVHLPLTHSPPPCSSSLAVMDQQAFRQLLSTPRSDHGPPKASGHRPRQFGKPNKRVTNEGVSEGRSRLG